MHTYEHIATSFENIGARATIRPLGKYAPDRRRRPMAIDVIDDGSSEYFDIQLGTGIRLTALDIQAGQQHLVLAASNDVGEDKFLCGHDERHWFTAALPHDEVVTDVKTAKEALKPKLVKIRERRKRSGKHPRRSDVFLRQGEWFFIPWPHARIDRDRIACNGRLVREAGSKPHHCEFLFDAARQEYVCDRFPKLYFYEAEYQEILQTRRKARRWNWRRLPLQPDIYVKGWITHIDHSPLFLDVWHRVELNRESTAIAMSLSRMVYLD